MDTDALPAALEQHPLVRRAVEELKMLTQTDQERERYEARRKAQLDYNTGLKVAHEEGREEGREEERIHLIHRLEASLNLPETPAEQLSQRSPEQLNHLIDQLLAQVGPKH